MNWQSRSGRYFSRKTFWQCISSLFSDVSSTSGVPQVHGLHWLRKRFLLYFARSRFLVRLSFLWLCCWPPTTFFAEIAPHADGPWLFFSLPDSSSASF